MLSKPVCQWVYTHVSVYAGKLVHLTREKNLMQKSRLGAQSVRLAWLYTSKSLLGGRKEGLALAKLMLCHFPEKAAATTCESLTCWQKRTVVLVDESRPVWFTHCRNCDSNHTCGCEGSKLMKKTPAFCHLDHVCGCFDGEKGLAIVVLIIKVIFYFSHF